jgi:hypothetical protein
MRNIFSISSLITVRLDSYDVYLNPGRITALAQSIVPVFKRFEKARHCLIGRAEEKKVSLSPSSRPKRGW